MRRSRIAARRLRTSFSMATDASTSSCVRRGSVRSPAQRTKDSCARPVSPRRTISSNSARSQSGSSSTSPEPGFSADAFSISTASVSAVARTPRRRQVTRANDSGTARGGALSSISAAASTSAGVKDGNTRRTASSKASCSCHLDGSSSMRTRARMRGRLPPW